MVSSVCSRRGRTGAYDHCARAWIARIKRIPPRSRKAGRPDIVNAIIKVLGAIAGRLHHDDAAACGVTDGKKVIIPPFDGDEALLPDSCCSGPGAVYLEQYDIAGVEAVRCLADCLSGWTTHKRGSTY